MERGVGEGGSLQHCLARFLLTQLNQKPQPSCQLHMVFPSPSRVKASCCRWFGSVDVTISAKELRQRKGRKIAENIPYPPTPAPPLPHPLCPFCWRWAPLSWGVELPLSPSLPISFVLRPPLHVLFIARLRILHKRQMRPLLLFFCCFFFFCSSLFLLLLLLLRLVFRNCKSSKFRKSSFSFRYLHFRLKNKRKVRAKSRLVVKTISRQARAKLLSRRCTAPMWQLSVTHLESVLNWMQFEVARI